MNVLNYDERKSWRLKEHVDEIHLCYYDVDEVVFLRQLLIDDIDKVEDMSRDVQDSITKIINRRFGFEKE